MLTVDDEDNGDQINTEQNMINIGCKPGYFVQPTFM